MVPGADVSGFVSPIMVRAVVTADEPSHTIAQTGPEVMKSTRSLKNGFSDNAA